MTRQTAETSILAQEHRALEQWAQGRPSGYVEIDSDEVTYFDDIAAHRRIDGIGAMRQYFSALEGKIPVHRYEMVDPKVQVHGEVGVLTFRYVPTTLDGRPLPHWKATSVYRHADDSWRILHAHWSLVKE